MVDAVSRRPRVVVMKTGDKLPELAEVAGDFEDWIRTGLVLPAAAYTVVAVHRGEPLPTPDRVDAVVITGSAAMVTDGSDWIETSAVWLRNVVNRHRPVLGICFGHQLLAYAMGGEVGDNGNGIEVGTVTVRLQSAAQTDTLFSKLPGTLGLHASHRQAVLKLPPMAIRLASSALDPHHAFRIGEQAWGVQFHPEFNADITQAYMAFYRRRESEHQTSGAPMPIQRAYDTPYGTALLRRFGHRVRIDHRSRSTQAN